MAHLQEIRTLTFILRGKAVLARASEMTHLVHLLEPVNNFKTSTSNSFLIPDFPLEISFIWVFYINDFLAPCNDCAGSVKK